MYLHLDDDVYSPDGNNIYIVEPLNKLLPDIEDKVLTKNIIFNSERIAFTQSDDNYVYIYDKQLKKYRTKFYFENCIITKIDDNRYIAHSKNTKYAAIIDISLLKGTL